VNVAEFLRSLNVFDILVVLVMFAFFIVGYIQGTIRRLLGIASIVFSFLVAANLRDPLGGFFAANWTQFPDEYSYMLAFGLVFGVAVVGFSITIQAFYTKVDLFEKYPSIDEVRGGLLGVLQGMIILGAIIVILDSFFLLPGIAPSAGEIPALRELFKTVDPSGTAVLYRDSLIPAFFAVFGLLLPDGVKAVYS
jgi:membrane protein required for colicin V production